jgi:hypothetical protein
VSKRVRIYAPVAADDGTTDASQQRGTAESISVQQHDDELTANPADVATDAASSLSCSAVLAAIAVKGDR